MMWLILFKVIVMLIIFVDMLGFLKGKFDTYRNKSILLSSTLGIIFGIIFRVAGIYFIWS